MPKKQPQGTETAKARAISPRFMNRQELRDHREHKSRLDRSREKKQDPAIAGDSDDDADESTGT